MVRSNLNDLIARAENPEKMLNQIIDDMRSQLAQAKQEVAVAIADERKLRRQVQDERDQTADWERRAKLALREISLGFLALAVAAYVVVFLFHDKLFGVRPF